MIPITVTFFSDHRARVLREELVEPAELARAIAQMTAGEKARLPWLKLAKFGISRSDKGSLRHDSNVVVLTGVEGDIDNGQLSFAEAIEIASRHRLRVIIYTSPSHTEEHPRLRVLAPLSGELPPSEHGRLVARLNGAYRGALAVESFTLSQGYYFGSVASNPQHRAVFVDGTPLDQLDQLDAGAIGKPNGTGVHATNEPLDEAGLIEQIVTGAAYHTACVRLIGKWAQAGVPFMNAQAGLEQIFDQVFPPDRDQRWHNRRADIPRIVMDIYGKQAGQRDNTIEFVIGSSRGADAEPAPDDPQPDEPQSETPADPAILTIKELRNLQIEPADYLLGELISTTSRILLVGPTGIGKSNLLLGIAVAVAAGLPFLHWKAGRPARVLYIDGEMSARLLQQRGNDAVRRGGVSPEGLLLLSRALREELVPLNFPAGQRFIDEQIAAVGGIDLLILDNVQCLLLGDMKDELPWQMTLPWIRQLTNRRIGQIWGHHTGHVEGRSYGTKTREWQLDTVMLLHREEEAIDLRFRLEFPKARERRPDNTQDFESRLISLVNDRWVSEPSNVVAGRPRARERALELLYDCLARYGEIPPPHAEIPVAVVCVAEETWRERFIAANISEGSPEAARKAFKRAAQALVDAGQVGKRDPWVWVIR